MRRPMILLTLLLIAATALSACGKSDGDEKTSSTTTAATTPAATSSPTTEPATPPPVRTVATSTTPSGPVTSCQTVAQPKPRADGGQRKPTGRLDPTKRWTVTLRTSCGDLAISLDVKDEPKTSASFASLVRSGFYDGLTFHRIVPGFVVQGGDPTGTGQGGPGYSVTEAPPKDARYTLGTVAMAKTEIEDPGTSGSQFFIVTGADTGLPADYALLGKVSDGLDTVKRIGAVDADPSSGQPTMPVVIEKATLTSSAGGG